jgi:hypothetical protein
MPLGTKEHVKAQDGCYCWKVFFWWGIIIRHGYLLHDFLRSQYKVFFDIYFEHIKAFISWSASSLIGS